VNRKTKKIIEAMHLLIMQRKAQYESERPYKEPQNNKSIKQQYGVINMTTKKNKQRKKQKHMEHIKHYEPLPEKFPDSAPEMALSGEEKSESSSLRYR
jgi:hypothetical protein